MKNILLFLLVMTPALVSIMATETLAVRMDPNQADTDTLTLAQVHEMVSDRFPLSAQSGMQREIRDLQLKNAKAGWLPELRLTGLAQYQSDVTEIDIRLPAAPDGFDIPTQPKDRYQMTLELEQRLYDGGRIRARRNLAHSRTDVALHRIRVSQHELRDRVNDAWFAIHALRAQQAALEITEEELEQRFQEITSLVEHGAVPASSADIIRAEQLRITQQMRSLKAREKSAISVLSILLDTELPADIFLQMPDAPDTPGQPVDPDFRQRPEMALFEAQRSELMQQEKMVTASYRPHISVFGQAAYGRPGLDMFEDRLQPWYIVGIRASWSIWNWRTAEREREILQIRQRLVGNQQEIFDRNMLAAVQQDLEQISELRETIRTDKEIIALHENIVRDAASRLEHGAITATEYISELTNRQRAVINRDMHRLELARTRQNYRTAMGLSDP